MKKLLLVAFLSCGVTLYAGSSGFSSVEVDKTIKSTKKVFDKIDYAYKTIENSTTGTSVYSILERYPNKNEAELAINWFKMATQLTTNQRMAFFILNSSYKVKALLSKLSLDKKKPLSSKDRSLLFSKIDYLVDRTATDKITNSDDVHKATKNLFIRSMPIVNPLTKKRTIKKRIFKVLKKGERFKLLYRLNYKSKDGYNLLWGFIETLKDKQRGWINLNTINIK